MIYTQASFMKYMSQIPTQHVNQEQTKCNLGISQDALLVPTYNLTYVLLRQR